MGTTQSTTTLPASGSASSRRMSACPAYGTATMTRSAAPATSTLAPPVTETSTPAAADGARSATSPAIGEHLAAPREPSRIRCPAAASRTASPRPWGPVPPITPTTSSSTARPSVTPRFCPGDLREVSAALPVAVLGAELLLALVDGLQRVLGLRPGCVRAQPVPLGAAVPRLDGVVLQAVVPGSLLGHRRP